MEVRCPQCHNPIDLADVLADVKGYLGAKVPEGLVRKDIFLATSTALALEQSGNYELASEAYRTFADVVAKEMSFD
jgi:hypothetical protein